MKSLFRTSVPHAGALFALVLATLVAQVAHPVRTFAQQVDKNTSPVTGHLPDPMSLDINSSPSTSTVTNRKPLMIYFCSWRSGHSSCVTPDRKLKQTGKRQRELVSITPPVDGEWRWRSDYVLAFKPSKPWPTDTSFTVNFDRKLFGGAITLDHSTTYHVYSEEITPSISNMQFFQDPTEMKKRGVGLTVRFNTPVDADSLRKHLRATLEELTEGKTPAERKLIAKEEHLPFEMKMNGPKTEANVTIPLDVLPDQERFVRLNILPGVKPKYDGIPSKNSVGGPAHYEERVLVPSRMSYLKVSSVNATTVKNSDGIPEQIISFETNVPLSVDELKRSLTLRRLPADKPPPTPGQSPKKNYAWNSAIEVTPEVLATTKSVGFAINPIEGEFATLHSIKFRDEPGGWLYIQIAKGMKADGGYILGADYNTTAKVPDFGKEVRVVSPGSLLSLSGEKKLPIYALGIDKIQYDVGRVITTDLQHLVTQSSGSFSNPSFENWNFKLDNLTERTTRTETIPKGDPAKPHYTVFDFAPFLTDHPEKHGIFFLTVSGIQMLPKGQELVVATDQRLVVLTDIGFAVKTNRDRTSEIFVQSLRTGAPLGEVTVEVLGANGLPVFSSKTNGLGHTSIPDLSALDREKTPAVYVARLGQDLSFMPYSRSDRRVEYSRFDTEGVSSAENGLRGYLFSDRGIYRPGEDVHIGMVVKQADWSASLDGLPLLAELSNPRGTTIEKKLLKLNTVGLVDYNFSTEDSSPTGQYLVSLSLAENGRAKTYLGSTTVRIEEFLPDTMKIAASFSRDAANGGWVSPTGLTAEVVLRHLYGAPATQHRVKATLNANPGTFSFPQFSDYSFFDPKRTERSFDLEVGEELTNDSGVATFPLDLTTFGDSTYRLTFYGEGFAEGSGRSVKTARTVLVSSLTYVVGFKPGGNLEFINKGTPRSVDFIAVDPKLTPVAAPPLTAKLARLNYLSTLIRDPGTGQYRYRSVAKETAVEEHSVVISEKGLSLPLSTDTPGNYVLTLVDSDGLQRSRLTYTVVGAANLAGHEWKAAEIQVKLNRAKYEPGETVELSIVSPYTGTGIITLETERVHSYQWFSAETQSSVQKFPIPKDFSGKGFLNVQFVRSLSSPEVFTEPFGVNVTPVFVSTDSQNSKLELTVPEKVMPGETLSIRYRTKERGKIAVFAIDEGILQYGRYKTPDPLSYLINQRSLQVETKQIFDLLLPEYSLMLQNSAPGGDASLADGKNLNPFKRKTLPPVAFWSGIIDTDVGEQEVHYEVPTYFNGALRVMAVAVTETSVGAAEKRTEVKGELIISPNVPTFVAPGDEFIVGLRVANNRQGSGANSEVVVTVTPSEQLEIIGDAKSTLVIPEGREVPLSVRVKAKDNPGGASITFLAESGPASASYEATLSVRPAVPSMTTLVTGYVDGKEATVQQERPVYEPFSSIGAALSTMPLSILPGLREYLEQYPYGCTEQILSRLMPIVVLYGEQELQTRRTDEDIFKTLSRSLTQLSERQSASGGFGLWGYTSTGDEFTTAYALHILTLAKEKNLPVPDQMFQELLEATRNMVNRSVTSLVEARHRAYGIYLLTRNGVVTTNYIPYVLQYVEAEQKDRWKHDLTAVYIAATYRLLELRPEASALLKEFIVGEPSYWQATPRYTRDGEDMFYDSLIRYSQFLAIVSDHFPEELKTLDRNILFRVANFVGEGSYNTTSSSYATLGLVSYAKASQMKVEGSLTISERRPGGEYAPLELTGKLLKLATVSPATKELRFSSDGSAGLFYQLVTTGFDRNLPTTPVEQGIEIQRKLIDRDGNEAKIVKLGDAVDVIITVRAQSDSAVENIAVVDLIPGGFEIVPDSVAKSAAAEESEESEDSEGDGDGDTEESEPEEPSASLWYPIANDVREDRCIAFGTVPTESVEYRYRVKAVNAGTFTVPPAFAESMYERSIKARGVARTISVEP